MGAHPIFGPWALRPTAPPPATARSCAPRQTPRVGMPARRASASKETSASRLGNPSVEFTDIGPPITTTPSKPADSNGDVVALEDAAGVDGHPRGDKSVVDGERRLGGHVLDNQAVRHW